MKKQVFIGLTMIFVLVMSASLSITYAQEDHGHMMHDTHDHCDNPVSTQKVVAEPNGQEDSFGPATFEAGVGECLTIEFENTAADEDHSFVIDPIDGVIDFVHIHVMNSTAGPNGDGIKTTNIQLPDEATTLTFYCNVSDHRENGMVGEITVSSGGGFLPGFDFSLALITLGLAMVAVVQLRKREA